MRGEGRLEDGQDESEGRGEGKKDESKRRVE